VRDIATWFVLKEVVIHLNARHALSGSPIIPSPKCCCPAGRGSVRCGHSRCESALPLVAFSVVPGVSALQCTFSEMIPPALGAVGDYVARTYDETKHWPRFVVTDLCNVQPPSTSPARAVILVEHWPRDAFVMRDALRLTNNGTPKLPWYTGTEFAIISAAQNLDRTGSAHRDHRKLRNVYGTHSPRPSFGSRFVR
jgi:hypothetical protein